MTYGANVKNVAKAIPHLITHPAIGCHMRLPVNNILNFDKAGYIYGSRKTQLVEQRGTPPSIVTFSYAQSTPQTFRLLDKNNNTSNLSTNVGEHGIFRILCANNCLEVFTAL